MSGGQVRKVVREDIQLVQNLIERCLQLYMNRKETVDTLLHQAKIDPAFTELVWQRLEEQNHEFFRIYYTRLLVKDQIMRFNALLEIQMKLMSMSDTGSILVSNESQVQPDMHQTIDGNLPHVYVTGEPSVQSYEQTAVDVSAQSVNLGMMPGPNAGIGEGVLQQAGPGIGNPSLPHFRNAESSVKPVKEDPWAADTSCFGFLGRIPRNFSFSDLTVDFPDKSEILGGYSGPAFVATDTIDFLDPQGKGEQEHQDISELDTASEDLSFDDPASD